MDAVTDGRRDGSGRWRVGLVLGTLGLAGAVLLGERIFRRGEVSLSSVLLRWFSDSGVYLAGSRETVYFGLGGPSPLGLRITPECSAAFLLLPLLLVTAAMLWFRPQRPRRMLFALAVASALVVLLNQARVLTIAGLVDALGVDRGYYWGHTLLGSLVSVLGGAVALVVFVLLATRGGTRGERRAGVGA